MISEGTSPFWGKCKVVIDGDDNDNKVTITQILENSTTLNVEQGEKKELIMEGGEVVATRYNRNKYTLEFQEIGKASVTNTDGLVAGNHKVELFCCDTGSDVKVLTIPSAVINIQGAFSSENGTLSTYSCAATKQTGASITFE